MADLSGITVPGLSYLKRRLDQVEKDIRFLRSSRDLVGRTALDASKEMLIQGVLRVAGRLELTGALSMKSAEGAELVRIGDMEYGRGFELKRDDESPALLFRKPYFNSTTQSWELRDRNGVSVVAENFLGTGLARPHLEHPFQPVAAVSGTPVMCGPYGFERSTSSGTFETLFAYDGKRQNGFLDLKVAAMCSDGTTAGEVRIVDLDTGVPLAGFLAPAWLGTIPAGTTALTVLDPVGEQANLDDRPAGFYMRLGLQVRRTAGAGSITLAVPQSIGG